MARQDLTIGNSQAFPSIGVDNDGYSYGGPGLTKREYFAAVALQGIFAFNKDASGEEFARKSVKYADALIDALNK